ncbi:MAG: hypothetical protein PHH06_04080 [Candidatus Gracilibacteria bacterium]|nr:hypothetical protein [Candidatus Gracilibacteria bacterium]
MKDIIEKYHKHKMFSNVGIIAASLVLALSINFLILEPNNIAQNLKTSVLEAGTQENKADIYLENKAGNLILLTSKSIDNLTNLTLSFAYNPENVGIKDIVSGLKSNAQIVSNTPGISTVIIDFSEAISFESDEELLKVVFTKNENKSEQLNIINANFTDNTGEIFMLTTSGVTF